ncbi:MAG: hypothetical protein RBS21_05495 [Corynebacterium sp.]|jgi:hypothetical protein|nr:hypothetical protein [Corynebacterium sp.]
MNPDPNINATAQSVSDKLDGTADGSPLPYRAVALLHPSEIFSLSGTVAGVTAYPYPEGPNTSTSILDGFTTLAKILGRTYVASDGKTYDVFDMLATLLEKSLSA